MKYFGEKTSQTINKRFIFDELCFDSERATQKCSDIFCLIRKTGTVVCIYSTGRMMKREEKEPFHPRANPGSSISSRIRSDFISL